MDEINLIAVIINILCHSKYLLILPQNSLCHSHRECTTIGLLSIIMYCNLKSAVVISVAVKCKKWLPMATKYPSFNT